MIPVISNIPVYLAGLQMVKYIATCFGQFIGINIRDQRAAFGYGFYESDLIPTGDEPLPNEENITKKDAPLPQMKSQNNDLMFSGAKAVLYGYNAYRLVTATNLDPIDGLVSCVAAAETAYNLRQILKNKPS